MKFDRSCKLINVPGCNSFLLTQLTLIDIDILNSNKITVKAVFNSGKCIFFKLNLVEILQLLHFIPYTPYRGFAPGPHWVPQTAYTSAFPATGLQHKYRPAYI